MTLVFDLVAMTLTVVQDPNAALAMVSARPEPSTEVDGLTNDKQADDPDLNRAKDLLELHGTVKLAHQDGTDKGLNEAREAVAKVLRTL